jgi:hypothetical protein
MIILSRSAKAMSTMEKESLSGNDLESLLIEEMNKIEACRGGLFPSVYRVAEEDGCNWDVDILLGPDSTMAHWEKCEDCMQEALQALRAKYRLLETD